MRLHTRHLSFFLKITVMSPDINVCTNNHDCIGEWHMLIFTGGISHLGNVRRALSMKQIQKIPVWPPVN